MVSRQMFELRNNKQNKTMTLKQNSVEKQTIERNLNANNTQTNALIYASTSKIPNNESVANSVSGDSEVKTSQLKTITNYFGLKNRKLNRSPNSNELYFDKTVETVGNISTIVLKFSSDEINAYKLLLQVMTRNVFLFQIDSSKLDLNMTWKILSEEMASNGFKKWNSEKCRDSFIGSIKLYRKVFKKSLNFSVNSIKH